MTDQDNAKQNTKEYQKLEETVKKILEKTQGASYIFRGENNKDYEDISCTLYRAQKKILEETKDSIQEIGNLNFPAIEQEIIKNAKRFFPARTSDVEILTQLQHYGGATTLLDFTRNIHIALFFACRGETESTGRIICLNTKGISKIEQKLYEDKTYKKELVLIEPSQYSGATRVTTQHSVFVHCPDGFLEDDIVAIPIPAKDKRGILEALRSYYDISEKTMFNDIQGFIASAESYKTADTYFYIALSYHKQEYYAKAIENYDAAIRLNPDLVEAYYNRGNAEDELGKYDAAIADYDAAIRLNPDYAKAYNNRGNVKYSLGKYDAAIADYDEVIRLKPDLAEAYYNRGNAEGKLGKYDAAIADYDEAIRLKPDYAKAYNNRGNAEGKLGKYDAAIADYDEAIRLKPDDAEAYYNRGNATKALGDVKAEAKEQAEAERYYKAAMADFQEAEKINPSLSSSMQLILQGLQNKLEKLRENT